MDTPLSTSRDDANLGTCTSGFAPPECANLAYEGSSGVFLPNASPLRPAIFTRVYRLITIKFSHYNEKARWGLEHFGVPYKESAFMPLLHMPAVALAIRKSSNAAADKVSTKYSTPVLELDGRETISDSSKILRYLDEHHRGDRPSLYPSPETWELDQKFSTALGAHTRRLAYYFVLDDSPLMNRLARQNVGRFQSTLFALALPAGRKFMKKSLRIDAKRAERSRTVIEEIFAEVSERLSDGRAYLCGDRFSAADISFACMTAPILAVSKAEGFGAHLPTLEELPSEAQVLVERLRATPAGRFALQMFEQQRS